MPAAPAEAQAAIEDGTGRLAADEGGEQGKWQGEQEQAQERGAEIEEALEHAIQKAGQAELSRDRCGCR